MKFLLVDNDPVFLTVVENFLKKENHKVLTAHDGLSALDILKEYTPDFIFIDYVMPNINGATLCRILKKDPKLNDCFIVILSAVAAEDWANEVICGADAYIAKTPLNNIRQDIFKVIQDKNAAKKYCASGKVYGLEAISPRAITRELLTSKKHYNSLLKKMSEGILELNSENRIVYANPSSLYIVDKPEHEILGLYVLDLFPDNLKEQVRRLIENKAHHFYVHDDDRVIMFNQRYLALSAAVLEGCEEHSLFIIEDITDLKKTEISLRETNDLLNNILDSSQSYSIVSTDLDQNIIFWNKGAEKMLGYSAEEVVGKQKISILYPEGVNYGLRKRIREGIEGKKNSMSFIVREITKGGDQLWVKIHLSPRMDADGNVIGILGIGENVTEIKKIEEEKEELQNQVLQSRKAESIGCLAGGVAHDFNNLLMGIQGHISIAMLKVGNQHPARENLNAIEESVLKGANITDRLLNLAQGAKGPVSRHNLNIIIRESLEEIEKAKRNVQVILNLSEDLWEVDVSESQIRQAFLNIFDNSLEAMDGTGILSIKTKNRILNEHYVKPHKLSAGKYVEVTIDDTGTGMDQQTLEKIFDPFFTTRSRGSQKGSGLGLATVYTTIKNHHGIITAKSKLGEGTSIEIFLPVSKQR